MAIADLWTICTLMGVAALLYTAVGHAGASAYLAIMAVFGFAPDVMRPTALVLNIAVASLASWRFVRAGQFDRPLLIPLVVGSLPLAFLGGHVQLNPAHYRPLVAFVLAIAALRLVWPYAVPTPRKIAAPPLPLAVAAGAAIGFLSGLTGTGGGIFLSPLLVLAGWTDPRRASGIAATFILLNSTASLAGSLSAAGHLPAELPWFLAAVMTGALAGTTLGTSVLSTRRIVQVLGGVLAIAAGKLVLT